MTEFTIPTASLSDELSAARDALATVMTWGGALPIELRLATSAAFTELEVREDLPYPPAVPAGADPQLTLASATALLARARDLIRDDIADAEPRRATGLGFAARELSDALHAAGAR
jgi:hypothetical protein